MVGAGLAGLTCSRWLAERGQSVLLVDRKATVDQAVHTTGIFVRRTLDDFALPEHCLGPAVRDVRLYSPRRRMLALSSPHDEFRVGRTGPTHALLERCRSVRTVNGSWESKKFTTVTASIRRPVCTASSIRGSRQVTSPGSHTTETRCTSASAVMAIASIRTKA